MVTSNKLPDKKVVKMAEHNNGAVVPQRTLLGEVNEHITCPLCRGYYIDATTIVECLHSFCRSCIIKHLQVKSYCPVCEMMINSAKPNIKLDKALQDIVYKLVPGLFQKEMERRQQFYASRPGPAATATPEQRGEDTERIIFSPEDVISFSLEYADATDSDSISSKSSDSNEPQIAPATSRRFLQCPAVVNISHLKKFLSMKFDIDSTQFAIDILYKRVPLPDYYTLMDIAYIYNWKRNEPMRFFYQIIDYVAIRNRLFDINRKGSHFRDRKSSPASTEDTSVSSPAPNLNDQGSEASSGTDSPMPDENSVKTDTLKQNNKSGEQSIDKLDVNSCISLNKSDEDVEKSQFLNSFELTAKSNCLPIKSSPTKTNVIGVTTTSESVSKIQTNLINKEEEKMIVEEKLIETLKRKHQTSPNTPEFKKLKIELEKAKIPAFVSSSICSSAIGTPTCNQSSKTVDTPLKSKEMEGLTRASQALQATNTTNNLSSTSSLPMQNKESKQQQTSTAKQKVIESPGIKRTVTAPQNPPTSKRKPPDNLASTLQPSSTGQKTVSPLKLQVPKLETQSTLKPDIPKPSIKKMPDLKPSVSSLQSSQNKGQQVTKVRMDLLANNSDPTIDRSKILSQVKSSLSGPNAGQTSGDPLKSLFDSCKINIPSSLSITLTDQKLESRNPGDSTVAEPKKNMVNKNLAGASSSITHKVPSPPVHNYIEILKLPDTDSKKQNKMENSSDSKLNPQNKTESSTLAKPTNKTSETSAKGPVPNLKPISDTKLGKQSGNFSSPITFQQTFEQQLQSLQCDKKSKLPKTKAQVPKLVPATPKSFSAVNKSNISVNKSNNTTDNKPSAALDLSTPHNSQAPLGPQQTFDKAFETMQSIANLAKKQNLPSKGLPLTVSQSSSVFPSMTNRLSTTGVSPLRIPSTNNSNQIKLDKIVPSGSQINNSRQELLGKNNLPKSASNASPTLSSPNYQIASYSSSSPAQSSPRSQTRSPSSSPKLVIAEEKQGSNTSAEQNINQSNQITSTQVPNIITQKSESPKATPGPSKPGPKPLKSLSSSSKITGIRQPITPTLKSSPSNLNNPTDYLRPQLISAQHALLRHQMDAWYKAQRQYDFDLFKNMTNMAHQTNQNNFNNKEKQ